jgi:hypothetical protein
MREYGISVPPATPPDPCFPSQFARRNNDGSQLRTTSAQYRASNRAMARPACVALLVSLLALAALAPQAIAAPEPRHVKPDRAAINALLDEFVPDAVAQKDLQRGWELSAGAARTTTHAQWLKGDTSVQRYPAKGTRFHGWTVNYSYPGDVGFDILLQPTRQSIGAWSFRAEAQKLHGTWKITTWYPVATFAPPGRTQTVLGPNDLGPSNGSSAASVDKGRLAPWVLLIPAAVVAAIALGAIGFATSRWLRRRGRVRELQRSLSGR